MPKNKKQPNKAELIFIFNREKNTHSMEAKDVNGEELLLSYQSLKNYIEEKIDMPIEIILKMAYNKQEKDKTKENKEEEPTSEKDYFSKHTSTHNE